MARDYKSALPTITSHLRKFRLANIGAITPVQLDQLYYALGWESGDADEVQKGRKNLLVWIRQKVPGMDVEKGSKVGWDRKVRDSMIVREERLRRTGDVDDGSDAQDSVGEDCGGEENVIGDDINGDIHDDDDINVMEGSRQELPLDKEYDYFTPGWKPSSATMAHLRNILTSRGIGQEEVSSVSKEEKRQKKGKQENEKEKEKENRVSQSNNIHNRTGFSGMTSPVDASLVDVMEDVQRDTTTPQDELQAELNRAIYERDALAKASVMRDSIIDKLGAEKATLQSQLELTVSQTQSEVAQLHRNQLDLVTRLEATIQQRCDEGKADLQTQLEQQHTLAMAELCVEQQHLRVNMQHLQDEHTRLQSAQAVELSTLRAEQDELSDLVRRLRADATLHLAPTPIPVSNNTVPRPGLAEKTQLEEKTELEVKTPLEDKKELEEDASTMVLLRDILTAVPEHACAGRVWKCVEGLGRAMELVVQIGQRQQHSAEEEKGSAMEKLRVAGVQDDSLRWWRPSIRPGELLGTSVGVEGVVDDDGEDV